MGIVGRLLGLLAILASLVLSACSGNGTVCIAPLPDGGAQGVLCGLAPAGNGNKVTCNCTCQPFAGGMSVGGQQFVSAAVCLPPDLVAMGASLPPTDPAYQQLIFNYCQDHVTPAVRALGRLNQDQCSVLGTNVTLNCGCSPRIQTNGLITIHNDACDTDCADVNCVVTPAGTDMGNCSSPTNTNDAGLSFFDPTQCICSRATNPCQAAGQDPPPFTSDKVCVPTPGFDPPPVVAGLQLHLRSAKTTIEVNHDASMLTVTAGFSDHFGNHKEDTQTTMIEGDANFYGTRNADGSADLILDLNMFADNFTFHFTFVDFVFFIDVSVTRLAITGGTGTTPVHFDANGVGFIPSNALTLTFEALQNGTKVLIKSTPQIPIPVVLNHATRTFEIPQTGLSLAGSNGNIRVVGRIVNRPPVASAPASQAVECTSPGGASATLTGSANDPDGDIVARTWFREPGHVPVIQGATGSTTAPLGTTHFVFEAADSHFQTATADTAVVVRDTTAPTLDVALDPPCVWPPDHKMVLYQFGSGISASASDACDFGPRVRIVKVTSNQPMRGAGSGNTSPDIRFGNAAFCVRTERAGTLKGPRQYTVTFIALDATGNGTTKEVVIEVPHDQNPPPATQCTASNDRVVDDDDARCTLSVADPATALLPAQGFTSPSTTMPGANSSGCDLVAPAKPVRSGVFMLMLLLLAAALRCRMRRG